MDLGKRDPTMTEAEYNAAHVAYCKVFVDDGIKVWIKKGGPRSPSPSKVCLDAATEKVIADFFQANVRWWGLDYSLIFREFVAANNGRAYGMAVEFDAPELSFSMGEVPV